MPDDNEYFDEPLKRARTDVPSALEQQLIAEAREIERATLEAMKHKRHVARIDYTVTNLPTPKTGPRRRSSVPTD
jgi:hypothetical protein